MISDYYVFFCFEIGAVEIKNSSWKNGTFPSKADAVYDYKESAVESKLNFYFGEPFFKLPILNKILILENDEESQTRQLISDTKDITNGSE